jgi:hypothetical protein
MTELERVKEFMETLEFHGYIDHDSSKLDQLIEDYYPLKQGQTLPLDSVTRCVLSDKDQAERKMLIELQQDEDRWFSEDEFNRLLELNKKALKNHKALHGG